ncbi:hypothetical protein BGZ75_008736 [Mortierella antarctica]|nr:hypothetical protein BGZ75_008736 [Mortierella antarctica]
MSGLQFGLNIKRRTGPALTKPRPAAARPAGGRNAFGGHSSDEDNLDESDHEASKTTSATSSSSSRPTPFSSSISSTSAVNKTLRPYAASTLQSTSVIEQQNAALAQDATVFDYDGVYDQLKAVDRARELARKQDSQDRKPKYVNALLQAAETRKRDRQIAEEKRIEREREKEGEEFKDKEQFITPAYKAQKEAMRLAEEEDRKREELMAKDKDGSLMQGFYRTMLEERTKLRPGLVVPDPSSKGNHKDRLSAAALEELEKDKRLAEKDDRQRAMEAREQGMDVVLNDEGQIVDKRQLLKGGLNIVKKTAVATSSSSSRSSRDRHRSSSDYDRDCTYAAYKESKYRSSQSSAGRGQYDDPSADQRARMTEKIEQQLVEQEKQREEEEKVRQESIREALKRKNQDDQVMDAKARYLARKKAAEAAKKD